MKPEIESTIEHLKQTVEAMAGASPRDVRRLVGYAKAEALKADLHDVAEAAARVELEASKPEISLQPSIRHLTEVLSRASRDENLAV